MQASIVCISDSDKHFASAIQEYEKRLGSSLIIHKIKPVKYGNKTEIITKETAKIVTYIQKRKKKNDGKVILCEKGGEQLSTEKLKSKTPKGSKHLFIIGGPYGLDTGVLKTESHSTISFGKQTMPHGLALLVLIEQIYRISMIEAGRSYHY